MAGSSTHVNYGGRGPLMMGLCLTEAIIGTFLVVLRAIYARTHSGKLRTDFVFVALGVTTGWGAVALQIMAMLHGVGEHMVHVPLPDVWEMLKYTWMSLVVGIVSITFVKLSIIALLLQVTLDIQPGRRVMLWGVGVLVVLVNAGQIPVSLTQCTPTSHLWYRLSPGSCPRAGIALKYGYMQGAVAVASDLFLAIYPSTIIWSFNISRKAKIGFCLIMAGGILPAAAGIVRTVYTGRLQNSADPSYELSPFLIWVMTEGWFVVILGSLPPLRSLFERVFGRKPKGVTEICSPQSPRSWGSGANKHRPRTAEVILREVDGGEDWGPDYSYYSSTTELRKVESTPQLSGRTLHD